MPRLQPCNVTEYRAAAARCAAKQSDGQPCRACRVSLRLCDEVERLWEEMIALRQELAESNAVWNAPGIIDNA